MSEKVPRRTVSGRVPRRTHECQDGHVGVKTRTRAERDAQECQDKKCPDEGTIQKKGEEQGLIYNVLIIKRGREYS